MFFVFYVRSADALNAASVAAVSIARRSSLHASHGLGMK
jgi:hypothetical protein